MSVVMYVKPGCPYCQAAREHLRDEGADVEERDATQNADWKAELMSYTNNRGVVPTIVRDGHDVQVGFPPGRG
jgi:glutaredoxin 3